MTNDRLARCEVEPNIASMSTNGIGLHAMQEGARAARDPVCKMQVDLDEAATEVVYADRTYYFCSEDCAELFRMRPEDYVPGAAKA
jgi:YHS domain-containing protein